MLAKQANDLSKNVFIKGINPNIFEEIKRSANAGFTRTAIPFEQFKELAEGFPASLKIKLDQLGYSISYSGDYLLGEKVLVIISWKDAK